MLKTLSLCPTCYRKIEASITYQNGLAVMVKECPEHGPSTAVMERMEHVANFYSEGTLGRNNSIIIHIEDRCNMACPWCYYPIKKETVYKPFSYYDTVLGQYRGFNLLLSGGEPTIRPDFFQFIREGAQKGWRMSAITNMLKLADKEFMAEALESPLHEGDVLNFAMSMQHPKNYSKSILLQKVAAVEALEAAGVKAQCAMFSIQSLDELDYIRDWYNHTHRFYGMLRIRTMFGNWQNKGAEKVWLSDLHKAFLHKFSDLLPKQSLQVEKSNMYCLYLEMKDGMQVSLSSSPTVENIDYHQCSRPVHMLAEDGKCYPVPICQIVSEGIEAGWKDGYRLKEV